MCLSCNKKITMLTELAFFPAFTPYKCLRTNISVIFKKKSTASGPMHQMGLMSNSVFLHGRVPHCVVGSSNVLPEMLMGVNMGVISNSDCATRMQPVAGTVISSAHICIFSGNSGSCNVSLADTVSSKRVYFPWFINGFDNQPCS